MATPQFNPRTVQAPPEAPDLPATPQLTQYLRSFALWCRHGFADKLSGTVAQPGIMIQAVDKNTGEPTPYVYMVGVEVVVSGGTPTSPSMTFTLMPLGTGRP